MSMAVPLGLIINELMTNALKYAFKGMGLGEISIRFEEKLNGFHLRVEDNGVGLPDDFSIETTDSFGLRLTEGLVNQLNGHFQIFDNNGTCVDISLEVGAEVQTNEQMAVV